jgi:antitoxin MazE
MRVTLQKWGNSASVRIPSAVMKAARLSLDETVDVREEGGRIVIEPIRPRDYDLAQLLAGIAPENLHAEVDFGAPTGREAL